LKVSSKRKPGRQLGFIETDLLLCIEDEVATLSAGHIREPLPELEHSMLLLVVHSGKVSVRCWLGHSRRCSFTMA